MAGIEEQRAELASKRAKALAGGGSKRVQAQHKRGKMTARERIERFVDGGSFVELEAFVTSRHSDLGMDRKRFPGDGVVTGQGTVDGQSVFVAVQDFTVLGGSLGEAHADKICRAMDLALQTGVPFVQLNDSGGARIHEGVAALNGYGRIFRRNTLASGVIPQISVILGPSAGGACYSPGITDFVFVVDGVSRMFITGPDVIRAVTGEQVSGEDLGGSRVHAARSGVAHFRCPDERSCFEQIKRLLSFLPANNRQTAPRVDTPAQDEEPNEALATLLPASPNQAYDVRRVIEGVVDRGDFLEVHAEFAPNCVVGFGRMRGRTTGFVANQPAQLSGVLDINASDKIARFVRFCDAFNVPLVNLVDVPGFLPGTDQEYGGIIRHGAKLLYAYSEATVPKVSLILRKAYGGAFVGMCSRDMAFDRVMAYPGAEIAVMGPEGAANIIFRKEIAAAEDPAEERARRVAEYRERFANPYQAAALGLVDEVVDPADTRRALCRALEMLVGKRDARPAKKHGNIPL